MPHVPKLGDVGGNELVAEGRETAVHTYDAGTGGHKECGVCLHPCLRAEKGDYPANEDVGRKLAEIRLTHKLHWCLMYRIGCLTRFVSCPARTTLIEPSISRTAISTSLLFSTPCSRISGFQGIVVQPLTAHVLQGISGRAGSERWSAPAPDAGGRVDRSRNWDKMTLIRSRTTTAITPPVRDVSGPSMAFCTELEMSSNTTRSSTVNWPISRLPASRNPTKMTRSARSHARARDGPGRKGQLEYGVEHRCS